MGYDLTNASGGYHQWKSIGWWHLLNLAVASGWSPVGTLHPAGSPSDEPWDGNYFQNAGQRVSAADAAALALALQRTLDDPNREAIADRISAKLAAIFASAQPNETDPHDVAVYPAEYFREMMGHFGEADVGRWSFASGDNDYLRAFIAFCRIGEFSIE